MRIDEDRLTRMLASVKKVALCSLSPAKVAATQNVCASLFPGASVFSTDMKGLPDQPLGRVETRRCAMKRAEYAIKSTDSDIGIGMEGGVDFEGWLISCVAVVTKDGQESYAWGSSFALPKEAATRILFNKEEMGPVMDNLFALQGVSKSHGGAVGQLTNGLVTRAETLEGPLVLALIPFLHPLLYASKL